MTNCLLLTVSLLIVFYIADNAATGGVTDLETRTRRRLIMFSSAVATSPDHVLLFSRVLADAEKLIYRLLFDVKEPAIEKCLNVWKKVMYHCFVSIANSLTS